MPRITCKQAREIPIIDYLKRSGFIPVKINLESYWYLSPFRNENTASFKVNVKKNAWYDFGIGEGGNLVDLGIRLKNCTIEQFLAELNFGNYAVQDFYQNNDISRPVLPSNRIIILGVTELKSENLLIYLRSRGIDPEKAKLYCKEVSFSFGKQSFYAIGFQNRSGGIELRNNWFKGSSSPKDITFIDNGLDTVCVLEGFIDFLSLLALKPKTITNSNLLILNSLSLIGKSITLLKKHKEVYLFLNNDQAALIAHEKLKAAGIESHDESEFYKGHNDLNDFLVHQDKLTDSNIESVENIVKISLKMRR